MHVRMSGRRRKFRCHLKKPTKPHGHCLAICVPNESLSGSLKVHLPQRKATTKQTQAQGESFRTECKRLKEGV